MDRPYIICHMTASIDGKVTGSFLNMPETEKAVDIYYEINRAYRAEAFACGRITMEGSFTGGWYPDLTPFIGVDIPKMLVMVRDVLGALFLKLWRYFRVRIKNFHITVASADAAQTAMMYGVICGYGDAIMKILEKALDFKIEKGARVGADIDYLSEEMKIDAEIDISISIGGVFRYLFGIIGAAVAGALRGLKIGLNKKFFSQKSQYKRDIKEYREKKAIEDAKKAEKEAAKEAKKAEKEAKKAAKAAESGENAEVQNEEIKPAQDAEENNENETKNEVLVAETPEREINNGTEE